MALTEVAQVQEAVAEVMAEAQRAIGGSFEKCYGITAGSHGDGGVLTMLNVVSCLEQAAGFDAIQNHTCFEGLPTAGLVKTPNLTTLHDGFPGLIREMSAKTGVHLQYRRYE